jgi:plastocyanin
VAGGTKQLRNKVLSTSATSRGKSLLLRVQTVRDANGDGRFATSFAGPDERTDAYWEGSSAGLYVLVVGSGPAAGFVRQAGAVTQVNLQGSQFSPRQVTVPAGSVVKWTNKESLPHTITVDATNPVGGGPNSDAQFPSGFGLNQSYNWTVPNAPSGTTFYYHCRFHGAAGNGNALGTGMSGSVTVQ